MARVIKNTPVSAGDVRYVGLIPRSKRTTERRHSNPLQYSFFGCCFWKELFIYWMWGRSDIQPVLNLHLLTQFWSVCTHTHAHKLACNSCPKVKLSHLKLLQVFSPKAEKLFTLNMKTCNKFNYTKLVTCSFPLAKIQKKNVQVTNMYQSQHNPGSSPQ